MGGACSGSGQNCHEETGPGELQHYDDVIITSPIFNQSEGCEEWRGSSSSKTSHTYSEVHGVNVHCKSFYGVCAGASRELWRWAPSTTTSLRRFVSISLYSHLTVLSLIQYGLFCYTVQSYCSQIFSVVILDMISLLAWKVWFFPSLISTRGRRS